MSNVSIQNIEKGSGRNVDYGELLKDMGDDISPARNTQGKMFLFRKDK